MKNLFFTIVLSGVALLLYGCNNKVIIAPKEDKMIIDEKENNVSNLSILDQFAKCLTDKGAKFYGSPYCGHCTHQKQMFGDSIKFIDFINCIEYKDECEKALIRAYPTWIFGDGSRGVGVQSFEQLSKRTGCEYSKEE